MSGRAPDRFLTSVLMTDMVGSTELAAELGDRGWRELVQLHNDLVRDALRRHGGREMDTAGDGFFAIFDAPASAILCALEVIAGVRDIGVQVRAGVHVGEVEQMGRKVGGITVPIAARISSAAGPGEVLVSSTVRDLAAGAGLAYVDRGVHALKGVPGEWRLHAVTQPQAETTIADGASDAAERRMAAVRRSQSRPVWQRHPRAAAGAAAMVLAVIAGAALLVWSPWRPPALTGVASNTLGLIDADRNEIIGEVEVGQQPVAVAQGEGAIWVANAIDATVQRIDPERQLVIHTVDVGISPMALVAAHGSIWVANSGERSVSRINAEAGRVVDTIEVGNGPSAIAAGADAIWVASRGDATVVRLDPASGSPGTPIPVGAAPSGLAVDDSGVWVTSEDGGTLLHLDPASGVALAPPIPVGSRPIAVASGAGAIWVASATDGTVTRIDPQTNRVTGVAEVGGSLVSLAAGDDDVWAGSLDGLVHRLDPNDLEAAPTTIATGAGVAALAPTVDGLWLAAIAGLETHRGGIFRIAVTGAVPPAEPIGTPPSALVWSLASDGLVTYPRVSGPAGTRLVPALAASMPTITDGGLTLVFRLRPGLVYSDGRPVGVEDFRNAVERLYQVEDPLVGGPLATAPVGLIRGDDACADAPVVRCDLAEGIVTDATAGTITFHLTEANPDFLDLLASIYPIPADAAPPNAVATEPIPGTGPYMVVERSDTEMRLVRNPYFESWNQRDRPSGFADEIVVTLAAGAAEATRLVEQGDADLVVPRMDSERIDELRVQYPAQLHFNPVAAEHIFMDTSRPPFDSLEARRAVNLALDRALMAEMRGGAFAAAPICQMLPPNFPGYQPYCPWTIDPDAGGAWNGPDLDEARRLIDASGTRGMPVAVGPVPVRYNAEVAPYLVSVLEELGYVVSLETAESNEAVFHATFVEGRVQVGMFAFAGSTTAHHLANTCDANLYLSNYCDPELDARITAARTLDVTDPAAAAEAWAAIDREVTDLAIHAPFVTEGTSFVSARVRNFQHHVLWGMLVEQAWVE